MKKTMKKTIIAGIAVLLAMNLNSQVKVKNNQQNNRAANTTLTTVSQVPFWTEDFGISDKTGERGTLAENAVTNNGSWTVTRLDSTGQKANKWYISSTSAGVGVGNCSNGILKDETLTNKTLHIGFDYKDNQTYDLGAIFAKNESSATNSRVESPIIDCSGKSNITLNFNYFTGGVAGVDFCSLYYFDGVTWSLITTYGPSSNDPACDSLDRATWRSSDTYQLPASADNNPEVRIGFRWKNEASVAGNDEYHSVAIDNIILSDNSITNPQTPTNDPTAKAANQTKTAVSTPVSSDKVYFNIYPNPNKGHFTIDFSGIENNHEVFITLVNMADGRQVYSSSFFSKSIELNKVDIYPNNIANGRYICTLSLEGIRKTVILVVE
jgi:hypothetical protein